MNAREVPEPILNSPFAEPEAYWRISEHDPPERRQGRRPAMYFYRRPGRDASEERAGCRNRYRTEARQPYPRQARRVAASRVASGEGGVTRTTMELLRHWHRDGRRHRLFFAQLEAAETIIFLTEARADFLQGIDVPLDQPGEEARAGGMRAFRRYACKMATGSGKTTVMGMLAAWSILNKVTDQKRRALLGRGARRLPECDDPQPPGRAQAARRRSEPVPNARSRPLAPHAATRCGGTSW